MFFCDDCKDKNDWPDSIFTSFGRCEICGLSRNCNDVPSKYLPPVKPSKKLDIDSIT